MSAGTVGSASPSATSIDSTAYVEWTVKTSIVQPGSRLFVHQIPVAQPRRPQTIRVTQFRYQIELHYTDRCEIRLFVGDFFLRKQLWKFGQSIGFLEEGTFDIRLFALILAHRGAPEYFKDEVLVHTLRYAFAFANALIIRSPHDFETLQQSFYRRCVALFTCWMYGCHVGLCSDEQRVSLATISTITINAQFTQICVYLKLQLCEDSPIRAVHLSQRDLQDQKILLPTCLGTIHSEFDNSRPSPCRSRHVIDLREDSIRLSAYPVTSLSLAELLDRQLVFAKPIDDVRAQPFYRSITLRGQLVALWVPGSTFSVLADRNHSYIFTALGEEDVAQLRHFRVWSSVDCSPEICYVDEIYAFLRDRDHTLLPSSVQLLLKSQLNFSTMVNRFSDHWYPTKWTSASTHIRHILLQRHMCGNTALITCSEASEYEVCINSIRPNLVGLEFRTEQWRASTSWAGLDYLWITGVRCTRVSGTISETVWIKPYQIFRGES